MCAGETRVLSSLLHSLIHVAPCSQGIEVHAPSQPSHAATSSTCAAEVLLVRSTHCPGSGSHCCVSCLRVFHHCRGWLGLPHAIDLGPFSISSSLPGPAEFAPHPLGEQDVPWSVITCYSASKCIIFSLLGIH